MSSIQSLVPNPTDGKVNVNYIVANGSSKAILILTNNSGQQIATYNLKTTDDKIEIDSRLVPAGMYFTTLVVDGKKVSTKKLIVTK